MTDDDYDPAFAEYRGGRIRLVFSPDMPNENPAGVYAMLRRVVDTVCGNGKRRLLEHVEELIWHNKCCDLSVVIAGKSALDMKGMASPGTWAKQYRLCDAIGRAFSDAVMVVGGGHNQLAVISGDASFVADVRHVAQEPGWRDDEFSWCQGDDALVHARELERHEREEKREAKRAAGLDWTYEDYY